MTDYFLGGEGPLTPADAAVALIVLDDGRYLLQLRDQKAGIFYPGYWGLFGGAIDPGETPEETLKRELDEELGLDVTDCRFLTDFSFKFGRFGYVCRHFYEVPLDSSKVAGLRLGEGRDVRPFRAADILNQPRIVPYDAFAIWLHATGTFVDT